MLFGLHGLIWLAVKTDRPMFDRAVAWAHKFWWALLAVLAGFLIATGFATRLYVNYLHYPILFALPLIAVIALILVKLFLLSNSAGKAFFASCVSIALVTMSAFAGLFPTIVPSTLNPAHSLTIYNSSSSEATLIVMLVVVILFVPVILFYQAWANILFKDKVSSKESY
jgi:cytochrome d ubiquinol oxidase subunit II